MTGIVGGVQTGRSLKRAVEALSPGTPPSTWYHENGAIGLGLAYTELDQSGTATWTDGKRAGVVYGTPTNLEELGWSLEDLFERLLDRPEKTARMIEGAFAIACHSATENRHLLVTDKLGGRPVYYTEEGPLFYASSVDVLLPSLDDPETNIQAVNDMLMMGSMWGNETLVEGVRSLHPATILEVEDEERTLRRYWKPDYTEQPATQQYIDELARRYRQATRRVAETLPSEAGIWLSGGLDSRTTASALLNSGSANEFTLTGYTYNANPPTNDNPELAGKVAQKLGIELRQVPLTADLIGENFERLIEATDGMIRWNTAALIGSTYGTEPAPVMMEGMQGELIGDHLYRRHLTDFSSAVESQISSETAMQPEAVKDLLDASVDPLASLKREADRSPEPTVSGKVKDIHFQNYYSCVTHLSNRIMREEGSSRTPHIDGDYLEWCAQLPRQYRKGGLPIPDSVSFTSEGAIPYGTSRAKLGLIRAIDPELSEITYERTKVKPSRPYPVHVAGFFTNVLVNKLLSNPTYANGSLPDFWIRDTESLVHKRVASLIDDACSRSLFNADAVREAYEEQMDGKNNASLLGAITTLEYWIGTYLD